MSGILDRVNSPKDIKPLSYHELTTLADEIRLVVIDTVSRTGGHLASNLGVVELTLALHYVFDCPHDRIIWDVGHQCYTHKIITQRKERFHTLRQYCGISGFPKRSESPFDTFETGHSGTSISCALGLAVARDLLKGKYHVIAVIGDGSTTSGLAFEGLNQTGALKRKRMIVVLNDNEMSISPNVGALAEYYSRRMVSPNQQKIRGIIKSFLSGIPSVGPGMVRRLQKLEESMKGLFVPGLLFEELGFRYVGPIDGHDIEELIVTLRNIKDSPFPVLLHVVTKKGKGYIPAERDATSFHGASPFRVDTGRFASSCGPPTYTAVFGRTLTEMALKDSRILAITAAMCEGTGLTQFRERIPDRFYDVGIAEQHAVTFAAGLALNGMRPVVAIYSTFLQRAYDQLMIDVCMQNLPVIFAVDRSGLVGADGETHQGIFDLTYLRSAPNLVLMAPKDERELQEMLATALSLNGPVAIRFPRDKGEGVELHAGDIPVIPVPRAETVRDGSDAALVAVGNSVYRILRVAERLAENGLEVSVLNARFIKPLDEDLITSTISRHPCTFVVEENTRIGGFGSAILELCHRKGLDTPVVRTIGLPDCFIEHGSPDELRKNCKMDEEALFHTILRALHREVSH